MSGSADSGRTERATVRTGGTEVVVTLKDLERMRDALGEHLRQSDYYARQRLLDESLGSVRIDADGKGRIGRWSLGAHAGGLILRFLEPPGPEQGKAHRASVAKQDGGWTVTRLVLERMRPPRPAGRARERTGAGRLP